MSATIITTELPPLIEPRLLPVIPAAGMESFATEDWVHLIFWDLNALATERLVVSKLVMPPPRFCVVRRQLIGTSRNLMH